jgi:MFS family permease
VALVRTRDVWAISLSAFCADLGYQAVLAGFPLFLVIVLKQPVWEFGLATALSYGGGTFFSWLGGIAGDRIGHRRLAIAGNTFIPILSLSAVWAQPAAAIGLLTGGWWARNIRTPSRRVMLVEAVPEDRDRTAAFGFLHALDIGGGALAAVYALVTVLAGVSFRWIFLGTALPLAASTLILTRARTGSRAAARPKAPEPGEERRPVPGARPLLLAAILYGFTYYSVGFPVLTTAQRSHQMGAGIGAFLLFQAVSALTGYVAGPRLGSGLADRFRNLGLLGYLVSGAGAVVLAAGYAASLSGAVLLVGVAALGFALGVVETLEPSLMAALRPGRQAGRGMGALSAARSLGLFVGNLVMGLLYGLGADWAYGYAAVVALLAALVVVGAVPTARRAEAAMTRSAAEA